MNFENNQSVVEKGEADAFKSASIPGTTEAWESGALGNSLAHARAVSNERTRDIDQALGLNHPRGKKQSADPTTTLSLEALLALAIQTIMLCNNAFNALPRTKQAEDLAVECGMLSASGAASDFIKKIKTDGVELGLSRRPSEFSELVCMAESFLEDVESGIADGTYLASDNPDLAKQRKAVDAAKNELELGELPTPGNFKIRKTIALRDAECYGGDSKVKKDFVIDIDSQIGSNGQLFFDIAPESGNLDDVLSLTAEINKLPGTDTATQCVHVHFDCDNLAFSIFKIANGMVVRPEAGVRLIETTLNDGAFAYVAEVTEHISCP